MSSGQSGPREQHLTSHTRGLMVKASGRGINTVLHNIGVHAHDGVLTDHSDIVEQAC